MIVIIDYGMGNLRSVAKALERLGEDAIISSQINDIREASKLILPGVGHFKKGIENLSKLHLIEVLREKVLVDKTPILGICLGMQLLTNHSEEGNCNGLGFIDAITKKFSFQDGENYKVPHIGWNSVIKNNYSLLFDGIIDNEMFYFVHSYFVFCFNKDDIIGTTIYGIEYHSAFRKDNIFGVQFHPEKSHQPGLRLIQNFINEK